MKLPAWCVAACFFVLCCVNFAAGAEEPVAFDFGDEPMRFLENERIKLGVDLSLGGAITYLSDRENGGENMINSVDWGRQIQLSFYSGPRPFIGPNGEKPTERWAGLGWNPVQSGDVAGHKSKTLAFDYQGENAMTLRCIPMQWPHDNVPGDCRFVCRYTLDRNVFHLNATIINDRWDKTLYDACGQEMPALYTNGPWYKLTAYLGAKPFEDEPVTTIITKDDGKGWPWVNFTTPERWVALLDENGYGIGVYQPRTVRFTNGFHGGDANKGHGGPKDGQTGYIAPLGRQILDHDITWSYDTWFILGTLDEIRAYVKEKELARLAKEPAPKWVFKDSREDWCYSNGTKDAGWPIRDALLIRFQPKGELIGPETFWKAEQAGTLEIEAAFEADDHNNVTENTALAVTLQPYGPSDFTDYLAWSEGAKDAEKERREKAKTFPPVPSIETSLPITCDGKSRVYRLELSQFAAYKGAMKKLQFRFPDFPGKATVKRIEFKP